MSVDKNYKDMGHSFNKSILRAYDIRGVIGKTLNATDAFYLGKTYASEVQTRFLSASIVVGFDGRISSPELENSLVEGMLSAGAKVTRIGLGPTPMLYFAGEYLKADASIMVTGSHNPPDYNGFKMTLKDGPFFGEDILQLGKLSSEGKWTYGEGKLKKLDIKEQYINALIKGSSFNNNNLRVGWDIGNGAVGAVIDNLINQLPGKHIILNGNVDGSFPNHHPDPTVESNLITLKDTVNKEKLDLGIAFDGDGDRLGVVDSLGRVAWGDKLMCLYSREILKNHPGSKIIADVKASKILFDNIRDLGGESIMWKTGHSLIKSKMKEINALLAGEMSGHIFFADRYYGFDDALYAALRLIELVDKSNPLSKQLDSLPQSYSTPEIRVDCEDKLKFRIISDCSNYLIKSSAKVNCIDGVRVDTKEGWWLIRASNTQPALVYRCESDSKEGLSNLIRESKNILKKFKITIDI